jgi:agmatine deiminase
MPDEAQPHSRTWMAFGPSAAVWGGKLLPEVRRNLASIGLAIAKFEPVSMLVRPGEMEVARQLMGNAVERVPAAMDDLWMRDSGPVFVHATDGSKAAVGFHFNGWGKKQAHRQDAQLAALVAKRTGAPLLETSLVLEGGGIETVIPIFTPALPGPAWWWRDWTRTLLHSTTLSPKNIWIFCVTAAMRRAANWKWL